MQGWIGLHRKLMENPVWNDPNYLKLWVYCLFKASHKPHKQLVGNQLIALERGQFITGRDSLADDLNKGVKPKQKLDGLTWTRYLNNLEKWEMLNIKKTNKYSLVTIVNYDVYQNNDQQVEHQSEQQLNIKRTTDEQQLNTNNNVKNVNNEKKNKKPSCPKFEICDMDNAKRLYDLMVKNDPKAKQPNFDKWANDFRLLREKDERPLEEIKWFIDWSQNHSFWKTNILSAAKFREKYNQMYLQAKQEHEKRVNISGHKKQNTIDWENI